MPRSSSNEYELITANERSIFYENRRDRTTLPPWTMIEGSRDVLTNVSGRIASREGYTLDGPSSAVLGGILSSYDYEMHTGTTQHLRAGGLTSALNDGFMQYRYVDSAGVVTWRTLLSALTSTSFNFAEYWDTTALISKLLMVNGASSITEWTGGVSTVTGGTAGTITITGTLTWAEQGFYTTGSHGVTIGGVVYTATGGWGTTILTGVTPTAVGLANGDIVHSTPETTLNSAMTALPSITNDLIANLRNQIYVASFKNRSIYTSRINNYKSYSFTAPVRIVGEGALSTLDGNPTALIPQEEAMYVSAGPNQWYQTKFTLSADNTAEEFTIVRLKTGALEATQSQGLTTKIANYIVYVSHEPVLEQLGYVPNNLQVPQITDLSFPIVNDINSYDFTGGHVFYHQKFIYVSVPAEGVVRVYNMTSSAQDPTSLPNHYWEAPLVLPVSCFSVIDGELYGHDFNVPQTYKMFDGYNDNGAFINAVAQFAYNSHGLRAQTKGFNQYYVEGYISSNTTLALGFNYDLDGCQTQTSSDILGTDTRIVCIGLEDNSLGKFPLGKQPLGGNIATTQTPPLPPKFRNIKTMAKVPYYEYSVGFSSNGLDQQWEIVSFGPATSPTFENSADITT